MAKLKLEVESLVEDGMLGFQRLGNSVEGLTTEVNDFKKDSKTAFGNAAKEVGVFNDAVKGGVSTTKELDKNVNVVAKSANKLQELKKQIKEYVSAAAVAKQQGDILGFDKNIKAAGHLRDELKDLQQAVASVAGNVGENLTKALGTATSLGAQGFEAMTAAQSLFGEENKDVQKQLLKLQAIQSLARIAGEFADVGDRLKEIKLGLAPIITLYTKANSSLINFAKTADFSFNGIVSGTGNLFKSLGSGIANFVKSGIAGLKALGAAILGNPFGLILVAIVAIIGVMVALKDKVKPIAAIFEFLGKIIDAIVDSLDKFGQALGLVSDESERAAQKTIDGTEKVIAAIENRYDNEIKLASAAGKETGEIEKKKIAAVREAIKQQLAAILYKKMRGTEINAEELKIYEEGWKRQNDLLFEAAAIDLKTQKEAADKKKEAEKKKQDAAKQAVDKLKQLQKDLFDALLDLSKKYESSLLDNLTGKEKLDKQREFNLRDLELLRKSIEDKGKLVNKNFKFTADQENEFAALKTDINSAYYKGILKLASDTAAVIAEQRKKEISSELDFLQLKAALQEESVKAQVKPAGSTKMEEERFELEKQKHILEIKQQAAADSILLKEQQIDAEALLQTNALNVELKGLEGKNDVLSQARAKAIKEELSQIMTNADLSKKLSTEQLKNLIGELDKEIEKANEKLGKHKIDWQKILGVGDKEFEQLKQGFNDLKGELQNLSNAYFEFQNAQLDNEMAILDKRIEGRDKDISSLKDRLDKEEELGRQGLANNAERIKKELADKEAARQKDIESKKKLHEQQKKLAYAQFAIDTAVQASNLITAVSEVFATYGEAPYIAAALAAAMVASFALTKISAYNAIKNDTGGLKEGGYTGDGNPNEESGHFTHKGEFVQTAKTTKKYRNLMEGLHKEDDHLIQLGLLELLNHTGVTLPESAARELSINKEHMRVMNNKIMLPTNGDDGRLTSMEENMRELVKQGKEKVYVDAVGNTIIKRGSNTRVIRKQG